jgi:hypothetical protein
VDLVPVGRRPGVEVDHRARSLTPHPARATRASRSAARQPS